MSRLVAETLAPVADRVIYVPDSSTALATVTSLMNQPLATAFVVVDACPLTTRTAMETLLKQAATHAHKAARDVLVDWAMSWVQTLKPADLGSAAVLERLLPLVDVSQSRMGPVFMNLVLQLLS